VVKKRYQLVVLSNAKDGAEDAYNEWYTKQHIHDVVSAPDFVEAKRFRFVPMNGGPEPEHRYMAIYTVETEDLAAAHAGMTALAGTPAMMISDAIDIAGVKSFYFEQIASTED
jgi:hypothetical protein